MSVEAPKLIPSGIEPVDKLLGGLESGQLYIAYGDASAQPLFGVKFLIEGLQQKEPAALVTHQSPEEAMRQFARLGYDCLDDVQTGKLIILEYSNRVIEQVSRFSKLTPILQELEGWFNDAQPRRFMFDSISSLIFVSADDRKSRAREFAEWAVSIKATFLLVDAQQRNSFIREFIPFAKESFRIETKEEGAKSSGILVFEKSARISDQPIEIDAFRGVFLLADYPDHDMVSESLSIETSSQNTQQPALPASASSDTGKASTAGVAQTGSNPSLAQADRAPTQDDAAGAPFVEVEIGVISSSSQAIQQGSETTIADIREWQPAELSAPNQQPSANAPYDFSDFVAELDVEFGEFDLGKLDSTDTTLKGNYRIVGTRDTQLNISEGSSYPIRSSQRKRIFDSLQTDAPYLRRATDFATPASGKTTTAPPIKEKVENPMKQRASKVDAKNFNVAVIDYDMASCGRIAKALNEFKVEIYKDALSGIAGVMASPPDLVVLDIDAPIVDGFKVLAHIRASLPVPIIALSKFHIRASDRILSAELGADHYLTKPFSSKELQRKSRQLIARYRGVNSWIATPMAIAEALTPQAGEHTKEWLDSESEPAFSADFKNMLPKSKREKLEPYSHFMHQVEEQVKVAMAEGTVFSMVGFRLEPDTGNVKAKVAQLFDLVSDTVRTDDLISTNTRNDLVVLLPDTDTKGAKGFVKRLRKQITEEVNENLLVWIRNFPNLEEAYQLLSLDDSASLEEQGTKNRASTSAKA
jgi:DNA-binding response OmpR family regulator/KaiC/GvpD/RAD55 family RecA-like ATPase